MRRVPYRGNAPAMNDLVGGQIPIVIGTLADALQQHRAGTVRIIAAAGASRSPFLPDVTTLKEAGYDIVGEAWYGLWAPARTPADRVQAVANATIAALGQPDLRQKLEQLGLVPIPAGPTQLADAMRRDAAFWSEPVKASGFRMEN
jgi:tripartite-type tricarboxylate transporter receptor subunit TctC